MTLTEKQIAWNAEKAANRYQEPSRAHKDYIATRTGTPSRAKPVDPRPPRDRAVTGHCPDCPHSWKHHTAKGRCRPSCPCTNGSNR